MRGGANGPLGVCFGGPSPEHDVSILTGLQAAHELVRSGRSVTVLYWSKTGEWYEVDPSLEASSYVDGVPRGAQPIRLVTGPDGGFFSDRAGRGLLSGGASRAKPLDVGVVVNCCHGGPGEDGSLQAVFDLAGLSYTGPGVAAAALGMDKLAFCGLAGGCGLPVLKRAILDDSTSEEQLGFDGPFIVKPRFGGSSIGVVVVADLGTAKDLLRSERTPSARCGGRAVQERSVRPQHRGAIVADARTLGGGTSRARDGRVGDPRLCRQVRRRRGNGERARVSCRPGSPRCCSTRSAPLRCGPRR